MAYISNTFIFFNSARLKVLANKYDIFSFMQMVDNLQLLHKQFPLMVLPDGWEDVIKIKHTADTISDDELLERNTFYDYIKCFRRTLLILGKIIKKYGMIHIPSPHTINHCINEYLRVVKNYNGKLFIKSFTDLERLIRKTTFVPDVQKLKEIKDIVNSITDEEVIENHLEVFLYSFKVARDMFNHSYPDCCFSNAEALVKTLYKI